MYSTSSVTFAKTFDAMSKAKSLYIPLLPKDIVLANGDPLHVEEVLREFFEVSMELGPVSRIDYISKPTKVDANSISVFVHFKNWEHTPGTDYLLRQFNEAGEATLDSYYDIHEGQIVPFISSFNQRRRFFKIKVNHSPIPEVLEVPTNLSQIVHDNAAMKTFLIEKDAKIAALEQEIQRLNCMIHCQVIDFNTINLVAAEEV